MTFKDLVYCIVIWCCSCGAQHFNWAVVPLAAAALAGTGVELYSRLPQQIVFGSTPPLLRFDESVRHVTIVFPGAGGSDANTERIVANIKKTSVDTNISRFVVCYDWKPWCGNIFRAAFDSEYVGHRLGRQLAALQNSRDISRTSPGLESIHVIGVSVGAFAANSCIETYKRELLRLRSVSIDNQERLSTRLGFIQGINLWKKTPSSKFSENSAFCRISLLDPFTSRGLFGFGYGRNFFGASADFCEQFMNTDDPVPTTNSPLPLAHCYDITSSSKRQTFAPLPGDSLHSWPAAYFGLYWKDDVVEGDHGQKILKFPTHEFKPRGVVVKLS